MEKGEKQEEEDFETQLDVDLDAFIPENYMENEEQKLEAYQKIALLSSEEEKMDLEDELTDRYGDLPYQVENLFQVASLRNLLHKIGVTECKIKRGEIHFLFFPKAKINTDAIPALISESRGEIRFVNGESPKLLYKKKNLRDLPKIQESMEKAKEIAEALLLPLSP